MEARRLWYPFYKEGRHECARGDGWIEAWGMGAELDCHTAVCQAAARDGAARAGYRLAPRTVSLAAGDGRNRAVHSGRNSAHGNALGQNPQGGRAAVAGAEGQGHGP